MSGLAAMRIRSVLLAMVLFGVPARTHAQAAPDTNGEAPPQPGLQASARKWQISFRVGGDLVNDPTGGTSTLPSAGLPLNIGGTSSREFPSWFYGDGASLLNVVLPQRNITTPFVPLNSVLTGASSGPGTGLSLGFTLSKEVTGRLRLEFALDGTTSAPEFTAAALAGIEQTRASFASSWQALLRSGTVIINQSASATDSVNKGSATEWVVTGAAQITLWSGPRSRWYATLGGGLAADGGTAPTATLTGQYAFAYPLVLLEQTGPLSVPVAFSQSDTVTVQVERPKRFVGIVGGGWTHDLSRRLGVFADLRAALGRNGLKTLLTATPNPNVTQGALPLAVVLVANPAIIFGSTSSSANSLSGPGLSSFTTFAGSGLQVHAQLTLGFFLRF